MAVRLEGNTTGLKASEIKALNRFGQRRYTRVGGFSHEQARELAALSRLLGRQIGLLIDRKGKVEMVLLGDASSVLIPELPRERGSSGRLRGLRLLHTHLKPEGLSHEDLMDLLFLRLDSVGVLSVDENGFPDFFQHAHLLPRPDLEDPDQPPYLVSDPVAWERVDIDFVAQAEALDDELARVLADAHSAVADERAILVSVSRASRQLQERNLAELAELAATAGIEVGGVLIQRVLQLNPRQIIGQAKLAELEVLALRAQASLIVFDGELAPAQLHNVAELTERTVMDRTQLILNIFARHATTRAGKLQVEMAQLEYNLPRLVGRHKAMDRLMGGPWGRGPGETRLETDRRKARERMAKIRKDLDQLRKQRAYTRARRKRQGLPLAALVGYTNAGKSTLLNALTNSDVMVQNRLFATLDPTARRLRFPEERELILADTVGFIRNLPKELVEAFRATLEELEAADLLLHVLDAAHPELEQQALAVESILQDLGLGQIPQLTLLNKWDMVKAEEKDLLRRAYPKAVPISALTGEGLELLGERLLRHLTPLWRHLPRTGTEQN